jgi:AcrR family transcriptional regulator
MTSPTAKREQPRRERPELDGEAGAAELEAFAREAADAGRAYVVGQGDALVTVAYDLLTRCGLEGLTVRAVLTQAGVNRRAFYERFSGKDDLVLAVFEQSLQALAAQCRELIAARRDPLERLRYIVYAIVLGTPADGADPVLNVRRGAALCREHMRLAESRPDDLRLALRPLIALLAENLAAGVACGQVRDRPPEVLASLVYNLVSTTVHAEVLAQEAGDPARRDRAQLADDIWAFCRGGVVHPSPLAGEGVGRQTDG